MSRLCWMLAYGGVYAVANLRCASARLLSSVLLMPCQQAVKWEVLFSHMQTNKTAR